MSLAAELTASGFEAAAETCTPGGARHVEALHLADGGVERADADAADGRAVREREQEPAARRRVVARQLCDLLLETLERQVEPDPGRVLEEELPDVRHRAALLRPHELQVRSSSSSGIAAASCSSPSRRARRRAENIARRAWAGGANASSPSGPGMPS